MKIKHYFFQTKKNIGNQSIINEKTSTKNIKNDILYALISIYYYEKALYLNTNKELIFNEQKTYYFINPNWIIDFKKFYNYQMLCQILKTIKLKGISITYDNFEKNVSLIEEILSQNNFSLKNDENSEKLLINIYASQRKYNNLEYYPFCYIIDIKIKNIIQNYVFQGNKLSLYEKKVFAKNNFIYLNISNNIMSGTLDRNFIFVSNYALFFNSPEILLNEKNFLLNNFFSDYLKYKHIEKFSSNILPLKDENNNKIGEIMLVPKSQATNKNKAIILSASKNNLLDDKSKQIFTKILPNVIFNNTRRGTINKSRKNNINQKFEKQNILYKNSNTRNYDINQIKRIETNDDILLNNLCQTLKNEDMTLNNQKLSINENKDELNKDYNELNNEYFAKMNLPQNAIIDDKLKNKIKIEEDFDLKQKFEKKENIYLKKHVKQHKKQMTNIQNKCDNKINNYEKKLDNKNKVNDDLYNQNEIIHKENELNIRENKLIEKENYLNKRENIISQKEDELIKNQNNLNEKEKVISKKENEINKNQNKIIYKENELKKREIQLIKNQNNLNRRENLITQKEDELIKKEKNLNEREKEINNKLKENKGLSQNIKILKNENISLPIPPPEPNPIFSYKKPTLIGLNNIGSTNFINCAIQCLSQTPDLTNYFLKNSKKSKIINNNLAKENKNSLQLSPIYLKLIKKLWDKKGNKSFSPNEFMNTIEKMNPLFKKGQAGDSKDFIIYILEQIHKELKGKISKNYNVSQPLNEYDRKNVLNYFLKDFSNNCSIISDIFFGFTETTNECLNCKNYYNSQNLNNPICYNYGIFNCLIFPLEEVKNYKNNNLMQHFYNINNISYMNNNMININPNNSVTLDDCFSYNQKTDLLTGENKNYCSKCKTLYDFKYTSKIYSSPNNLILILNRGKNNIYDIKLYFNETIDITQYIVINNGNRWIYNLYGVITHNGKNCPNGHFVASCKSPVDNKWYRYNDDFVSPINDVQNEVINFGIPYILFYQKK